MYQKIDEERNKLKEYSPENLKHKLPLLSTMLKLHHGVTAEVDIERGRYITAHFKQTEHLNSPIAHQKSRGYQ